MGQAGGEIVEAVVRTPICRLRRHVHLHLVALERDQREVGVQRPWVRRENAFVLQVRFLHRLLDAVFVDAQRIAELGRVTSRVEFVIAHDVRHGIGGTLERVTHKGASRSPVPFARETGEGVP